METSTVWSDAVTRADAVCNRPALAVIPAKAEIHF
jgi:hypothetical protein